MSKPSPCPGCDVVQHGERVASMFNRLTMICKACAEFERVKFFRRKEVLNGVGRKA